VKGERHAGLTWGAAQAGVARGVLSSVDDGIVPQGLVEDLVLIAAAWVDWAAENEEAVYENNVTATRDALAAGAEGRPALEDLLAVKDDPLNPFFRQG
jgi:5,6,7,8-tetrahydromethanopterin hydro-lyase